MALAQLDWIGSSGGGVSVESLMLNNKSSADIIQTITTQGATWTATQDCVMAAKIQADSSADATVSVNGKEILLVRKPTSGTNILRVGYILISSTEPDGCGIFIPKNAVITTKPSYGTYDISLYRM